MEGGTVGREVGGGRQWGGRGWREAQWGGGGWREAQWGGNGTDGTTSRRVNGLADHTLNTADTWPHRKINTIKPNEVLAMLPCTSSPPPPNVQLDCYNGPQQAQSSHCAHSNLSDMHSSEDCVSVCDGIATIPWGGGGGGGGGGSAVQSNY